MAFWSASTGWCNLNSHFIAQLNVIVMEGRSAVRIMNFDTCPFYDTFEKEIPSDAGSCSGGRCEPKVRPCTWRSFDGTGHLVRENGLGRAGTTCA